MEKVGKILNQISEKIIGKIVGKEEINKGIWSLVGLYLRASFIPFNEPNTLDNIK